MGLFEHFPYTNFHELNLDWLLSKVKDNENKLDNIYDSVINNMTKTGWLEGKRIVVFGDSTASLSGNYIEKLGEMYNLDITNNAVPGTAITGQESLITSFDLTNFDICIICYGTNDWTSGACIKPFYNESYQWLTSINRVIDHVQSYACDLLFIFPQYVNNGTEYNISNNNNSLDRFIDFGINACISRNTKYLNLYNISNSQKTNFNLWTPDGIHPNDKLNKFIAQLIYNGIICNGFCDNNLYDATNQLFFFDNAGFNTSYDNVKCSNKIVTLNGSMSTSNPFSSNCNFIIIEGFYNGTGGTEFSIITENMDSTLFTYNIKDSAGYFSFKIPCGKLDNVRLRFRATNNTSYLIGYKILFDDIAVNEQGSECARNTTVSGSSLIASYKYSYNNFKANNITYYNGANLEANTKILSFPNFKTRTSILYGFTTGDYVNYAPIKIKIDGGNVFVLDAVPNNQPLYINSLDFVLENNI